MEKRSKTEIKKNKIAKEDLIQKGFVEIDLMDDIFELKYGVKRLLYEYVFENIHHVIQAIQDPITKLYSFSLIDYNEGKSYGQTVRDISAQDLDNEIKKAGILDAIKAIMDALIEVYLC